MPKKKIVIILSAVGLALLALAAAVLCVWSVKRELDNRYTLQVTLEGERDMIVEYGQEYQEPGATAVFFGSHKHTDPMTVPVRFEGEVDSATLGTYWVKYTAVSGDHIGTAYRRVRVVDSEAPVITLVADPEKYTFPNETYAEEGFSAADNHDGDVTELVQRTESREKITYTVTDLSGNITTVDRVIVYNDPIPPVLMLKGNERVYVTVGQRYQEPGYTATDNCDGDLTGSVSVAGSVDTTTPGDYTLEYTVSDSYDNQVTVSRMVTVKERATAAPSVPESEKVAPPEVVVPNGRVIYLTFDDGPGSRTPDLLDILAKYDVKATFFVVNTRYVNTIQRIVEEGHAIAAHTATHNFSQVYASEDAYFHDLYTMQEIIKSLTGVETTLMRFPGGSSNTTSRRYNRGIMTRLVQQVVDRGFQYFDWNVDSKDAGGAKTADQVFNNVVNGVSKREVSIVLQHDIKGFSIDAVERIIVWGLENGYTFLPLEPSSPGCRHDVRN